MSAIALLQLQGVDAPDDPSGHRRVLDVAFAGIWGWAGERPYYFPARWGWESSSLWGRLSFFRSCLGLAINATPFGGAHLHELARAEAHHPSINRMRSRTAGRGGPGSGRGWRQQFGAQPEQPGVARPYHEPRSAPYVSAARHRHATKPRSSAALSPSAYATAWSRGMA